MTSAKPNWPAHPNLYLGGRPISAGFAMLHKLGNAVVKCIGWITNDKSSRVWLKGVMIGIADDGENEASNGIMT